MTGRTKKLIWSTILISGFAFLSRIMGLLRATLLSARYGATESQGLTDCYAAAFKLPDIIFNLVAFGAISIVLIPYFSSLLKKEDNKKLQEACSSFLTFFFLLISAFIVIGFFSAPLFVRKFLVAGWTNESNILLTIKMTRILLLQVLFMTLSGIMGSYLNALERFRVYAIALLSYNVGIIFGILALAPFFGIEGVAWGAVLGSLIHLVLQTGGAVHNGFRYSWRLPKFNREVLSLAGIAVPRIIGISGEQFVKFFIVNFASFIFTGSIFIFENAENFSMVAYGMIAVSISTTAFPVFSKLYTDGDIDGMVNSLLKNLSVLLYLILPVVSLMVLLRYEIIETLVGYNRYTPNDVKLTADALAWYIIGIPFFSVTIIVVKFFYAQKRSLMPMFVSLAASAVTIGTAFYLSRTMDISGLSAGRSAGYVVQMILLVIILSLGLRDKFSFTGEHKKSIGVLIRTIIIATLAFTGSFFILKLFNPGPYKLFLTLIKLILVSGLFSTFYLLSGLIARIPESLFIFERMARTLVKYKQIIWKYRPVSFLSIIAALLLSVLIPVVLINLTITGTSKKFMFSNSSDIPVEKNHISTVPGCHCSWSQSLSFWYPQPDPAGPDHNRTGTIQRRPC